MGNSEPSGKPKVDGQKKTMTVAGRVLRCTSNEMLKRESLTWQGVFVLYLWAYRTNSPFATGLTSNCILAYSH